MRATTLLRLYPREWRERYGEEFAELLGPEPLRLQQLIDITAGAIDAWLSADVRGVTRATAHNTGGTMVQSVSICDRNQTRYTTRDGMIGAAIMLIGTAIFAAIGTYLVRTGNKPLGEAILQNGYLVAMTLSMPFWLTKGQSKRAQIVMSGVVTSILVLIALINY